MELAYSNRGQFLQVVLNLYERLLIRIYYRQLKINVITKSLESTLIGCRVRSVGTVPLEELHTPQSQPKHRFLSFLKSHTNFLHKFSSSANLHLLCIARIGCALAAELHRCIAIVT
jgi:hypothetical protein